MPEIIEIALAFDGERTGRGKRQHSEEGDIIASRSPTGIVGSAEAHAWIWCQVEIPDGTLAALASLGLNTRAIPRGRHVGAAANQVKHRFNINAIKLTVKQPGFNMARARNPRNLYQPFYGDITPVRGGAGGYVLSNPVVLSASGGLLHDKVSGSDI